MRSHLLRAELDKSPIVWISLNRYWGSSFAQNSQHVLYLFVELDWTHSDCIARSIDGAGALEDRNMRFQVAGTNRGALDSFIPDNSGGGKGRFAQIFPAKHLGKLFERFTEFS